MKKEAKYEAGFESVQRAREGQSIANDLAVIQGFAERGIKATPRDDVFTFWGWKALGRSVKKGEHGVKVTVWISKKEKDENLQPGEMSSKRATTYPKSSTVFHVSQTEPDRFAKGPQPAPAVTGCDCPVGAYCEHRLPAERRPVTPQLPPPPGSSPLGLPVEPVATPDLDSPPANLFQFPWGSK